MAEKSPLNLDKLITDIKALAGQASESEARKGLEVAETVRHWPALVSPSEWVPAKQYYALSEMMVGDDDQFLTKAYQIILKRKPDHTGIRHYSNYLQQGGSRLFVLFDLLTSKEARKLNIKIAYLTGIAKLFRYFPKRIVSRSCRIGEKLTHKIIKPAPWVETVNQIEARLYVFNQQLLQELDAKDKLIEEREQRLAQQAQEREQRLAQQAQEREQRLTQQAQEREQQITQQTQELISKSQEQIQQLEQQNQVLQKLTEWQKQVLAQLNSDFAVVRRDAVLQRNSFSDLIESMQKVYQHELTTVEKEKIVLQYSEEHLENYYVAFEDAFRGDSSDIKKTLQIYLPYLQIVKHESAEELQILDIGCGRGEWLKLLAEQNITARGVDLNRVMVKECHDQELAVELNDAIEFLKAQQDNSVSVITAFHIIEHLPFSLLYALFRQALRVLKPKGMIIFETPNPENILVGSHTFYHDFTHKNPITPTSIEFLARYNGFTDTQILRLHPYPENAKVKGNDALTERINGHLCGPQDFTLIARKP